MGIQADTDIDIMAPVVEVMGRVHLALGALKKSVDDRAAMQARAAKTMQPVFYTYSDTVVTTAGGFGVIRLTGPDQGHAWYVRGICIWIPSAGPGGATAPGVGDIFVSAGDLRTRTSLTQFNGTDWRDHFTTMSPPHLYSPGQIPLRLNEELYVVISTGTAATQYGAAVWVEDFEEGALQQAWSL